LETVLGQEVAAI